jgi:nitrous oxidase accessory protein NosD
MRFSQIPFVCSCALLLGCVLASPIASFAQRPERLWQVDKREMLGQTGEARGAFQVEKEMGQNVPSTESSVYVNTTTGTDRPACGSSANPCQTIIQGLKRAREIQAGNRAGTLEMINIEIAAGTYAESVLINLNWIRLRGAGPGVSTINSTGGSAIVIWFAQPVEIEGLTLIYSGGHALYATSSAVFSVTNCAIQDSRNGIRVVSAVGYVSFTTFTNNLNGATGINGSVLSLADVTITGISSAQGVGFLLGDNSMGAFQRTSISQTGTAVALLYSEAYSFGGINLNNNNYGFAIQSNSHLEVTGGDISNNSVAGLSLEIGSTAILYGTTIASNGVGVSVRGSSYLDLEQCKIKFNTKGVMFDLFGKGLLHKITFSENGTDTETTRGGAYYEEPSGNADPSLLQPGTWNK